MDHTSPEVQQVGPSSVSAAQHPQCINFRVGLKQQYPDPNDLATTRNTTVDVVAIHGFRAESPRTWIAWKDGKSATSGVVNWLRDREMLPSVIPQARILTYDWNSNIDRTASNDRLLGHADTLLMLLHINRRDNALVRTQDSQENGSKRIFELTAGIVFLGTPFGGSWPQGYSINNYRSYMLREEGFDIPPELIQYLRPHGRRDPDADGRPSPLNEMVDQFAKIVVPPESARLVGFTSIPLQVRHNMLHKHARPDGSAFLLIAEKVKYLVDKASQENPLQAPDAWIRKIHYCEDKLRIERLLGTPLDMEQCYINLAIVRQSRDERLHSRDQSNDPQSYTSPFSMSARLKVQMPDLNAQVELSSLFESCKTSDGQPKNLRRVLIRGAAGVGKTTLCKKIVHEFLHSNMWGELFTRVLWVPLRQLKQLQDVRYNLGQLFELVYFAGQRQASRVSEALWKILEKEEYRETLFLLDGLDEVSEFIDETHPGHQLLDTLFNMPNVIITTRPHTTIPHVFKKPDMELETVGFLPEHVQAYLEKVVGSDSGAVQEIRRFLQKHQLLQSLVRIPIQLDALCSIWDDDFRNTAIPETMSGVYCAIVQKLWEKDIARPGRRPENASRKNAHPREIDRHTKTEKDLVEYLAFSGIYNDVVELEPQHRDYILSLVALPPEGDILDERLAKTSFLRTSDPLTKSSQRSYHFIHLTFQEFFAAQYFSRQWETGELEYWDFKANKHGRISPTRFLQQHKYTSRYNIMWRFVIGLLDDTGKNDFFTKIQEQPLDLLGPTHQRLVMHCLTETDRKWKHRAAAEQRLAEWLLYECDLANTAALATDSEFPDLSLKIALAKGSNKQRNIILLGITRPTRYLSNMAVEAIIELLNDEDQQVRWSAGRALESQSSLPPTAVDMIFKLLENGDQDIRSSAIAILGSQSNLPASVVDAIIKLLNDKDNAVRSSAARALGSQSNLPASVVDTIIELLTDAENEVRSSAIDTLGRQSNLPTAVVEAIIKLSEDPDQDVRWSAARALGRQSNLPTAAVDAIVKLSKDQDQDIRSSAVDTLGRQLNLRTEAVNSLIELSEDPDQGVRWSVARALGSQSNLPTPAMNAIIKLSEDPDQDVRSSAVSALGHQSNLRTEAVNSLIKFLKDKDHAVQSSAVATLGRQSNLPAAVVDAIIELLTDPNQNIQLSTASALGLQSNLPAVVVEAIIKLSEDPDQDVRSSAARALGSQSNLPTAVVEAIIKLSEDPDQDVRSSAIRALRNQLNLSAATVQVVIRLLTNRDHQDVRSSVARALGSQSNLPAAVVEAIIKLSEDPDQDVRWSAARALGRQSNLPTAAVDAIVKLSEDPDQRVRSSAARALERQSNLPTAAVDAIIKLSEDPDQDVRSSAIRALRNQLNLSAATVQVVIRLLTNRDQDVRSSAARALGSQSNLPTAVVDAIIKLSEDPDQDVRSSAARALGRQSNLPAEVVDAIIKLSEDADQGVRWSAVSALGHQSNLRTEAVNSLIKFLKDKDHAVQSSAVAILGSHSNLPTAAVEAIIKLSEDADQGVLSSAASALGNQSNLPTAVVDAIIKLLNHKDNEVRWSAVATLGRQSNLPAAVVDAIIKLLNDKDNAVRSSAARALGSQSNLPVAAVDAIIRLLKNANQDARWTWSREIGGIPGLIHNFFDSSVESRDLSTYSIPPKFIPDGCQRTAIEGLGGTGRKRIALKAAIRTRDLDAECSVFLAPTVTKTTFENAYREICNALAEPGIQDDMPDVAKVV
ncbi:uncharacterized protein PG986_004588 [Apiospora aurea]|uniref:NACHT domain-containing protein n=1 Tax=Apiospora aurea TaxID=335848 RepID=A0ABR1QN05_9PEZI